ncbi:response regulator transcription factor [Desulfotruncus alcoholivorax]|uniref:response regulator transcription factor n=1 Tax=Desulfotruncus alcoholivorax TaxID=265477 RepID=UPI000422A942|nr:response regulator transcription factor [Desulfotruncus alcoholivorax]
MANNIKPHILVVEDEESLARFLQLELNHEGFHVETAQNGYEALGKITDGRWDLVLLDLMLPGLDGFEVCRRIREYSCIPIIMLTARDAILDKVKGLDIGADDYITKPFAVDELLARIRARLRQSPAARRDGTSIKIKDLIINCDTRQVKRNGEAIPLTRREFDLLCYLAENAGIVLSRETILTNVWGYDYYGNTNVVDVYISYLRAKIDEPFSMQLLHTVRGVGYTLRGE